MNKNFKELRNLLKEWNPLNTYVPPDEYDCLIYPLLKLLQEKSSKDAISQYLLEKFHNHFGVEIKTNEISGFVERLINWYLDNYGSK